MSAGFFVSGLAVRGQLYAKRHLRILFTPQSPISQSFQPMKIYFAGPLFTLAERRFNEELSAEIRRRMPACGHFPSAGL